MTELRITKCFHLCSKHINSPVYTTRSIKYIHVDEVGTIGKETKNIEQEFLIPQYPTELTDKEEQLKKITSLTPKQRKQMNITKQQYNHWKKQAEKGKIVKPHPKR